MLARALNESDGPDLEDRIRERIKFHCPDVRTRTPMRVIYRYKAYEDRVASVLGPLADKYGIERKGFWTKRGLRSLLKHTMYGNRDPDYRSILDAYDELLRDLNEGDAYDPCVVVDIEHALDPEAYIRKLLCGHQMKEGDETFQACLNRVRNGGREPVDIQYIRNASLLHYTRDDDSVRLPTNTSSSG
jgi:hypothetical protein